MQRALDLDPTLSAAHSARATIAFMLEWDWETGEAEFRRALELDPGNLWARGLFTQALANQGRLDEALQHAERVRELDPTYVSAGDISLGLLLVWKGDEVGAVEAWKRDLRLDPAHYTSLLHMGAYYCGAGRNAEGMELLERARTLYPETPRALAEIGACHAVAGRTTEADRVVLELEAWWQREYIDPVNLAIVHAALRNDDQLFDWLERGFKVRAFLMTSIGSDPRFGRLHSDSRFRDLVQRIGLREPGPRG